MSETAMRYEGREPVTRRVHNRPWIADLESSRHAVDRQLVIEEAIDSIEQTSVGTRVDIVTHRRHGHPSTYLYSRLETRFDGLTLIDGDRCHCGGYVTRVVV
jgi:putative CGCGG family rSAM target protein